MTKSTPKNQSLQLALTRVLEEIGDLPLTSSAWDLLPDFVTQVQMALAANRQALNARQQEIAEKRTLLQSELAKLCEQTSRLLAFFGFEGCESGWSLEDISIEETETILAQTERLLEALPNYEILETSVNAANTWLARREARAAIQDQEDKIVEMVRKLQSVLPIRTSTELTVPQQGETDNESVAYEANLSVEDTDETCSFNAEEIQTVVNENVALVDDEEKVGRELTIAHVPFPEGELVHELETETTITGVSILEDEVVNDDEEAIAAAGSQLTTQEKDHLEVETATTSAPFLKAQIVDELADNQLLKSTTCSQDFKLTITQWEKFFWQLVSEGDLTGAYWLTCSLASQNPPIPMPLPEWLLAAVQASWWLSRANGQIQQDLIELVFTHSLGDYPNERILATSAALAGILASSSQGLNEWLLDEPILPESVRTIIYSLQNFSKLHFSLPVGDIHAVHDEKLREEARNKLAEEAKQWLLEEPTRKTTLKRATDVWHNWTGPNGQLRKMIEIVSQNDTSQIENLQKLINEWRSQPNQKWLVNTDRVLVGRRPARPIDGGIRARLINGAESTVQLAEKWLDKAKVYDHSQSTYLKDVGELITTISNLTDNALTELSALEQNSQPVISPPVIRVLAWSLSDLSAILGQTVMATNGNERPYLSYPNGIEIDLTSGLHFRLICIPRLDVPNDPADTPRDLTLLAEKLLNAYEEKQTLADIFLAYLEQTDYRFVDAILSNLPTALLPEFSQRLQASKQHSSEFLENKLRKVSDAIEQSMVNGLLDENSRAAYAQEIEAIRSGNNLNHRQLHQRLSQIESQLYKMEQEHLQVQLNRWKTVYQRLQNAAFYQKKQQLIRDIDDFAKSAFARQDIIVVDELLARLEAILDSGVEPSEKEFGFESKRDVYQEFVNSLDLWERRGRDSDYNFRNLHIKELAQNLRRDDPLAIQSLHMESLTKPRREEVITAFFAWGNLKAQNNPNSRVNLIEKHVATLLNYLGFSSIDDSHNIVSFEKGGIDWAYLTASVSAGDKSPIPQFGSQHARSFDVVCLWERPGSEKISASLNNLRLNTHHVIVLYLGRLTQRWRIDLMQQMRKESLSLLVLDEFLLLFLAREKELRLPSFFLSTLPLARTNPYSETGPVPAEMFRGRADERRQLREPLGYSIVYGGRQLGKSALLQQVERDFHNPVSDRYVIRREIKSIGDVLTQQADPELVWQIVKQGLVEVGVIKTTSTRPDSIASDIRQMMLQNPGRSILVLLDEADNFLAADEGRNFEIVGALKAIMESTDRRFKVIFAGLHDVQRYEQVPNQPFAHLRGLGVGPLDAQSAKQLIRQPLEALGFRFPQNDESPILGIIAYSNSHPGLIQLFCHRLLEKQYQDMPQNLGPHTITREDVDAIYRQREVQEAIRQRFHWTLDLDARYRALAQIIVLEQMQDYEGFTRAYNVAELQQLAKGYLPNVFRDVDQDELRVYLKEMIGLGVLVRNTESQYRLRSPNLVRLVGNQEEILNSLSEMEAKPPTKDALLESYRAPLGQEANRYSPFTFAQSRILNARQYGVGLVFGSQALGIEIVNEAIKAHFIPPGSPGRYFEVTPQALPGDSLSHWLKRLLDDYGPQLERMIVTRRIIPGSTAENIRDQVKAAIKFCRRHQRGHHKWMRMIFVFDSSATLEWLRLPMEEITSIENLVGMCQ